MNSTCRRMFKTMTVLVLLFPDFAQSQAAARAHSIGFRGALWKSESARGLQVSGPATVSFSGTGAGGYMVFSSRFFDRWYWEVSIGGYGLEMNIDGSFTDLQDEVEARGLVPFLIGIRYNCMPDRMASSFQPYLQAGTGAYYTFHSKTGGKNLWEQNVNIDSDLLGGFFLGGGVIVSLTSWLSLNLDAKYHWVEFDRKNEYSGLEFGMGFGLMWGRQKEFFRITNISLNTPDIYPAYHHFYRFYPVATVTVKNIAGFALEVNVKSSIASYTERIYESGFIAIEKGQETHIPVYAIFGSNLQRITSRESAVMDLKIEARAGAVHTKSLSAELVIHTRNAWDGSVERLAVFLTPEDPEILAMSRQAVREAAALDTKEPEPMAAARKLTEALIQRDLNYRRDPLVPFYQDNRVQFAQETLESRGGDCDDLTVLFATLLKSAGIPTAFIAVENPKEDIAHVYLMFNTGLDSDQLYRISANEKRVVLRPGHQGKTKIWIPFETTLFNEGFDRAWEKGALQYLQEGIIQNGLDAGWVRVIDTQ